MSIKDVVISKASRAGLILKKHSPAILTGVAIVSGIAATATAIHSTLNIDKVIVEHNIRSQKIEKNFQIAKDPDSDFDYSEEAYKHDIYKREFAQRRRHVVRPEVACLGQRYQQ